MEAVERHLTECRQCSALSAELSVRAAYVGALMGALQQRPKAPARAPRTAPRRAIAAALVLAAACLLLIALVHKPVEVGQAGSLRRIVNPPTPVVQIATTPQPRASLRAAHVSKRPSAVRYYLALDDDPIESGVVLRVTLPDSGLLADVIFDEQGRPRAVRPLN
jgi:hypothetical protein